jgi:hypothetical protein
VTSSMQITSPPSPTSASQKGAPTNPAPPVTAAAPGWGLSDAAADRQE